MIFIKQQWLSTLFFSILLFGLLFISWFPSQVYSLFDRCNERACLLRNAIPQRESWQCCKLYRIVVAQWGYWGCCLCSLVLACLGLREIIYKVNLLMNKWARLEVNKGLTRRRCMMMTANDINCIPSIVFFHNKQWVFVIVSTS